MTGYPNLLSLILFLAVAAAPNSLWSAPPAGVPSDAMPNVPWRSKGVEAWVSGTRLYLVCSAGVSEIRGPRLRNVLIKMPESSGQDMLMFQPEPGEWIIRRKSSAHEIVTLELDDAVVVFDPKSILSASEDGQIMMPAKAAVTHGTNLRFEPQPHKNTVGYWSNEQDTAEWHFRPGKSGRYEVDILQGCGKAHGGSTVDLRVADQSLEFTVQETGHFQNFVWRTLGTVTLDQSRESSLQLVPKKKLHGAVMDVRAVRLVPEGTKRPMTPELADPAAFPGSNSQ